MLLSKLTKFVGLTAETADEREKGTTHCFWITVGASLLLIGVVKLRDHLHGAYPIVEDSNPWLVSSYDVLELILFVSCFAMWICWILMKYLDVKLRQIEKEIEEIDKRLGKTK